MYLQWKKSGRSECGNYQASKAGAHFFAKKHAFGESVTQILSGKAESAAENRAICQRHAWKIASQQSINRACATIGGAELSHALKVDSSQVSRWKLGRALVPARHCEHIAKMCLFSQEFLRPDLEFFTDTSGQVTWQKRSLIVGGAES